MLIKERGNGSREKGYVSFNNGMNPDRAVLGGTGHFPETDKLKRQI